MSVQRTPSAAQHLSTEAQSKYREEAWVGMPPSAVTVLVGAMEAWDMGQKAQSELDRYMTAHHGNATVETDRGDLKRHPALTTIEKCRQDVRMGLKRLAEIRNDVPEKKPNEFADILKRRTG
jgi:hypothetical protein